MKLSEMNTVELSEALCKLAAPVGAILGSDDVKEAMQALTRKEGETPFAHMARLFAQVAPVALDKHFDDVVTILGILIGKDPDKIRQQTGLQTMKDIRDEALPEIRELASAFKAA